jgi:hypothetical protein
LEKLSPAAHVAYVGGVGEPSHLFNTKVFDFVYHEKKPYDTPLTEDETLHNERVCKAYSKLRNMVAARALVMQDEAAAQEPFTLLVRKHSKRRRSK